jgi:hypothetical protein
MQCRTQPVQAGRSGCLSSDSRIGGDCDGAAAEIQLQSLLGSVTCRCVRIMDGFGIAGSRLTGRSVLRF